MSDLPYQQQLAINERDGKVPVRVPCDVCGTPQRWLPTREGWYCPVCDLDLHFPTGEP